MKQIAIIILLAGGFLFGLSNGCNNNYVSEEEFRDAHRYLNKRVDTVIINQKEMKRKIDSIMVVLNELERNQNEIKRNIDTLKAGQVLIYSEVTTENETPKQAKRNWANYLIDFLK